MAETEQSEERDLQAIALTAMLMVAEYEGELVLPEGSECEVCPEAAATAWLLTQAGLTLTEAGAYLRSEVKAVS